eukprot:scaffold35922_cov16-Tisochrysis_lutea.AAC.1
MAEGQRSHGNLATILCSSNYSKSGPLLGVCSGTVKLQLQICIECKKNDLVHSLETAAAAYPSPQLTSVSTPVLLAWVGIAYMKRIATLCALSQTLEVLHSPPHDETSFKDLQMKSPFIPTIFRV